MWSAAVEAAGQVAGQPGVRLAPTWLGIIVPVTLAAGTAVCRAFTARDRVRRKYSVDAVSDRDRVRAGLVLPVLAMIVVTVQPLVDWPKEGLSGVLRRGDPGDPETEVRRRLKARREFVAPLAELSEHLGLSRDADSAQERLLANEKRQGWAAGVFLMAWLYLSFWAAERGVAFPEPLTTSAVAVMAGALGFFLCERLASAREAESLAALAARAERLSVEEDGE